MPSPWERNTNTQTVTFFLLLCSFAVGAYGWVGALMYRYLCVCIFELDPLDRQCGCCFACESRLGRNGIITLGVQCGGSRLEEDWEQVAALIRFLKCPYYAFGVV